MMMWLPFMNGCDYLCFRTEILSLMGNVEMIKCNHRAHALNMHVHVKYQCRIQEDLRFGVRTCILAWTGARGRFPMHDSLEIKTLRGTWLMIRRELKQQAEETTEKKRREEKRKGRGGKADVCKEQNDWLPLPDSRSRFLGFLLSGCQADLSRWLASVSSLLKCDSNRRNLVQEKKKQRTVRMNGMYVGCKENSPMSRSK